jgi:hypothetical protein
VTAAAVVVAVPTDAVADVAVKAAVKVALSAAKAAATEASAPTNRITAMLNAANVLKDAVAATAVATVKTVRVKNHAPMQLQFQM